MDTKTTSLFRPRLLLGVLLVLGAAGWWAYSRHPAAASAHREGPPVPVVTARVASETVPVMRVGVGTVLPMASVTVHTRVDGQLDSVEFKEGQDVREGQVLVRLDARTYQAQLDQIQAQKARDEAQLANARADLQRLETLIKEDATTQQALDTQRALVNQLDATVRNDDAQVKYAQVQLSFATIAAPISGRVGARLVDPGNIVHAADAAGLLVINQIDPIMLQFTLPEGSFQAVNRALRASKTPLVVEALVRGTSNVLARGQLTLLNNQIDTSTGTIMLKALFANAEHKLWPGQALDARLVLGEREQALTVPSAVVQRSQNGLFAYVVEADDKVRMQPIELADTGDSSSKAVVAKGLSAGERVVVDGQYRLTPGAKVSERPAAKDTATAQPARQERKP